MLRHRKGLLGVCRVGLNPDRPPLRCMISNSFFQTFVVKDLIAISKVCSSIKMGSQVDDNWSLKWKEVRDFFATFVSDHLQSFVLRSSCVSEKQLPFTMKVAGSIFPLQCKKRQHDNAFVVRRSHQHEQ